MAVWGEYESGKELAQSGVGVLWAARPAGAPDSEEKFVIKTNEGLLFLGDSEQTERGSALFLEAASAQKALTDAGGSGWARILEIGRADAGAFYVADRYERSVQKLVVRGIKVGALGLRQVVSGIVDALIELRNRASRPHGNLKTTNVLIGGPDGPTVDRDPIVLTDLKPSSTLSAKDADEDVRAIGRLVYEMVMLRSPRDNVGLTVSMTADWSRLGGAALVWIDFVNRLLDVTSGRALPDLTELKEMIPGSGSAAKAGRKLPLLAVGAVVALAAVAGTIYFVMRQKQGVIVPPPPPPPAEAIDDVKWKGLLGFIENVLLRRANIKEQLVGDDKVWGKVSEEVRSVLGASNLEMPWDFLDMPDKGWGNYAILKTPPYFPSGWDGPTGIAKGNAKKLEEWRGKAAVLFNQAKTVDSWMKGILPADPEKEWQVSAWATFGWTAQSNELDRFRKMLSPAMGEMKEIKGDDLAAAIRFAEQGKQLADASKGLADAVKKLEDSGDEALKQFGGAIREYTQVATVPDLKKRVDEVQELAKRIGTKLDDKSNWDYSMFSTGFKQKHAVEMGGGEKKLSFQDFSVWAERAGDAEFQRKDSLTAKIRDHATAAVAKSDGGLRELERTVASPKRLERLLTSLRKRTPQELDVETLRTNLKEAKSAAESLAKAIVFNSNKDALEQQLATAEGLAKRADEVRNGEYETIEALVEASRKKADTLEPGFREALNKQIDRVAASKPASEGLGAAQEELEEGWLVGLRKLQEAVAAALPAKFDAPGIDASMLDAPRAAAMKAVGDAVKGLPTDQDISGVASLPSVRAYVDFRKNLAGVAADVAASATLMKSGAWEAEDVTGKRARAAISASLAIKAIADGKVVPESLAAWKQDYDEVEKLRGALLGPVAPAFDEAVKGVVKPPEGVVINRLMLMWALVRKADAASPSLDKTRLQTLDSAARAVLLKIEARTPAQAEQLRLQVAADKVKMWTEFMVRVAAVPDESKRAEALIAGRDEMKNFGIGELKPDAEPLRSMPGTRYNIVLSRLKEESRKLESNPAGKGKDDAALAARKADAGKVGALLKRLQAVSLNLDAVDKPVIDELDKASKAFDKAAFKADESGPMTPGSPGAAEWTLGTVGPNEESVSYKWNGHELVFRKLEIDGQSSYLCTREVSLGLFIQVAEGAGVEGVMPGEKFSLTKLPDDTVKFDTTITGPRAWKLKSVGSGIEVSKGVANDLFGWYPLPVANKDFNPPTGITFLPLGVSVAPPSLDLPIQYISPASAAFVAHRIGCRLPTKGEFVGALAAGASDPVGPNLRDEAWKAVFKQMQAEVDGPANRAATAKLKPCFPSAGIFTPEFIKGRRTDADADFHAGMNDGTLFFRSVEAPATELSDLEGNVAEYVAASPEAADTLARLADESLRALPPSEAWKPAVEGNIFVIGGSALSPSKVGEWLYDNKVAYPINTKNANYVKGFSDVGFRLAFSASGGSGSPIDIARKAVEGAKYAAVK